MTNKTKDMFEGEQIVREIKRKVIDACVATLEDENLNSEQRKEVTGILTEALDDNDAWNEKNSRFWYKYGRTACAIRNLLIVGGAIVGGMLIGNAISK